MDYNRISSNTFRAMQPLSFYRFAALECISGNAAPFFLPFRGSRTLFGQCRPFPFTVPQLSNTFRAMQTLSFYRFAVFEHISGNAGPFLLPFRGSRIHFGQCSPFPFTVSQLSNAFRAMQPLSFYRFAALEHISGNAAPFLLPFSGSRMHFGQCRPFPFTVSQLSNTFRAMQTLSFYRSAVLEHLSGNAAPFLLPFRGSRTHFGQCKPYSRLSQLWVMQYSLLFLFFS
jgi:hypothetical protein